MRAVVQRVAEASVAVDGETVASIGPGLVVLVGITHHDTDADAAVLADKVVGLRIFRSDGSGFDRSLADTGGSMLVVSQFTLYGDVRRGRRPSFTEAAGGSDAEPRYLAFVDAVAARGVEVHTGVFGAMMEVALVNDGPVTLVLETEGGSIR